jgi:Flp pilus assembly protein TadD
MLARQSEVPRANLRLALAWDGRYAEAVAGAQPRELADVLNNVGYVALLKGDHKQAEAYLTRAMETSASHHDHAWHNLSHLVTAKGQDADGAPTPLR